jgi:16S rRNA (guanine527-N7)-methyltransferase
MQIIAKYFPALSPLQKEQMGKLMAVYTYWNAQINVISRKDMENLYLHHVLHSLAIARIITFKPGTVVLDAGTGGGFPGIPLAIYFPEVKFVLVDSIAKKIKVVDAVIKELKLVNCLAMNDRVENLKLNVDFVAFRAVTEITSLFKWVRKSIIPGGSNALKNGLLALKGGELNKELKSLGPAATVFNLSEYFSEEYFETKKLVHIPR